MKKKKERHYNVPSQVEMLPARSTPKGLKEALNKVLEDKGLHLASKRKRRNQFYAITAEEHRLETKRNLERWIENANNSLIETPENKRRNLIKAAWRNVIRKETNEKRNTSRFGNAEVSGDTGLV